MPEIRFEPTPLSKPTPPTPQTIDGWHLDDLPIPEDFPTKTVRLRPAVGYISLAGSEVALPESEIVGSWEQHGVVKESPRFEDQVKDESRQATFAYTKNKSSYKVFHTIPEDFISGRAEEREGIKEIYDLLGAYLNRGVNRSGKYSEKHEEDLHAKSRDILTNLTFIGEKEYQEAIEGIGVAWKAFLDADPQRKLCVLTEANKVERFSGVRKSDDHLKNQILESFSDEELKKYSGRIVDGIDDIQDIDAKDARVVLLDDWTISGQSMRDIFSYMMKSPKFRSFADAGKVEINLIVASADRIINGLHIIPGMPEQGTLPVRAYYQSHYASTAHKAHSSYVTGLHAPVNYAFSEVSRKVARRMRLGESEGQARPPMLISIVPDYRQEVSTIEIAADELRRLNADELRVKRAAKQSGVLALKGKA